MTQTTRKETKNTRLRTRMNTQKNTPLWDLNEEDSTTIEGEVEDSEASGEATVAFKHVRA